MSGKRTTSSISDSEGGKKKAPKITPQISSPALTTTNVPTTTPRAMDASDTYTAPSPARTTNNAPTTPPRATTNALATTPRAIDASNPYTALSPAHTTTNAFTTPPRATTAKRFNLSPVQAAAVDVRKSREIAFQELKKYMERTKVTYKKLNNARKTHKMCMEILDQLRKKVAGFDQSLNVMQQIDSMLHESKTKGPQEFIVQLDAPAKYKLLPTNSSELAGHVVLMENGEEPEYKLLDTNSSDEDAEMAGHVVMMANGEEPANEDTKTGMKTSGEEPTDYGKDKVVHDSTKED